MKPTMPRGRKRLVDPTIPSHIDQSKLPAGIYWDRSGKGRWYVFDAVGGIPKRKTVAQRPAPLSELHAIAETRQGIDRASLEFVLGKFHKSKEFRDLAPLTRKSYETTRAVVVAYATTAGPLGDLAVARMTKPFWQRIIDHIADTTPTKANHVLRYVRRALNWGMLRGHCAINPLAGIKPAKERKLRRLPDPSAAAAIIAYAKEGAARKPHSRGSCAPYLWIVLELAYLLRLRGIEAITLTDAHADNEGVTTNRRKKSRDNLTSWSPRLRAAWDSATELRAKAMKEHGVPTQLRADQRFLIVSQDGTALRKSSFDSAWQRLVTNAMVDGIITTEQRFSPHGMKHRGITDTAGTRADKKEASGHRSDAMLDVYDHSLPRVRPSSPD